MFGNCNYLLPNKIYHFKELLICSISLERIIKHPNIKFSNQYILKLKETINNICLETSKYPKIIYQNRIGNSTRKIINEKELIQYLETKNIYTIDTSKLTPIEQLNYFYNADFIIAPHGAGLTNIIACQPKTKILELFITGTDAYKITSRCFNLDYNRINIKFKTSAEEIYLKILEKLNV